MFCPDIISLYFGDPWWLGSKFSQLLLYLPRFGLTVALEATIFTCFIRIAQRLFDPFKHRLNTLERQISDPEKTTWDPLHKHQTKHKKKSTSRTSLARASGRHSPAIASSCD